MRLSYGVRRLRLALRAVSRRVRVAVCCSVSQCVALCCSVLLRALPGAACRFAMGTCCSVLQFIEVCCSVLQYVAACYYEHFLALCAISRWVRVAVWVCVAVCCSASRSHVRSTAASPGDNCRFAMDTFVLHVRMSRVARTNESCRMFQWVVLHEKPIDACICETCLSGSCAPLMRVYV